jgi:diguanylate cyclase (GGDEF)-like protein
MSLEVTVLEEDEHLTELITSLLETRGHSVFVCASGTEGLRVIRETPPDLVIVGDALSDMDGITFIAKIRKSESKVKTVLVSRTWPEPDLYRALIKELQVSLVLQRPVRSGLFGPQIEALFQDQKPQSSDQDDQSEDSILLSFKQKFLASLPERLRQMEHMLNDLNCRRTDILLARELRRRAHSLKGTARSCGFDRIGGEAETFEKALNGFIDCTGEQSDELLETVGGALARAIELLRELSIAEPKFEEEQIDGESSLEHLSHVQVMLLGRSESPSFPSDKNALSTVDLVFVLDLADALNKATSGVIDAALIDFSPEAFAQARAIRSLSNCEELPIGVVCQTGEVIDRADVAHAGISIVIEQPCLPDELDWTLQKLVAAREGRRAKILVVDDDPDFAAIVALALGREGMLVRTVYCSLEALSVIEDFAPDLVLLDVMMPGMSGFELCRKLRSSARWQDLPILFLTAQTDLQARLNAFDSGADDYLPKPVANVELTTRVKARLERVRLLKERAERDALSGLLLRGAFVQQVTALLSEASRNELTFSLVLLDVDHFKSVNDEYGHLAGDRVIAELGKLLRRRFRAEDLRGRWGGQEFILVFRNESKDTMSKALHLVCDEFRAMNFRGDADQRFRVTFSAGIASYPQDGNGLSDLLQAADRRLYVAKAAGRDRIVIDG